MTEPKKEKLTLKALCAMAASSETLEEFREKLLRYDRSIHGVVEA